MVDYCIERPFMQTIRIKTESIKVAKWLALYYGFYFKPYNNSDCIMIEITELDEKIFSIKYGKENFTTDSLIKDFSDLLRRITVCDPSVFVLHGAAIEYLGKAYIFLAPSTYGKTTLASFLCEKDFGYITDDFTIISMDSLNIIPLNKPIHLRTKSLFLLNNIYYLDIKTFYLNDGHTKRHIYQPHKIINKEIPIHGFYFLKRNEKFNKIIKMSDVEKPIALLKSLMFYENINKIAGDINILSKFPCHILEYCDLNFIEKIIKKEGNSSICVEQE
ncbi:MAG: hypothetical protein IJN03_03020 [Bacilli bacterium]|nr:hypothetical protein [Bacilli bacterium]